MLDGRFAYVIPECVSFNCIGWFIFASVIRCTSVESFSNYMWHKRNNDSNLYMLFGITARTERRDFSMSPMALNVHILYTLYHCHCVHLWKMFDWREKWISHDYEWLSSCYFLTFFDRWGLSRVTNVHFFSLSSFCCLQWHCLKNKKRSRIKRKKKKKRELSLGLAAVLNAARVWIMTQNSSAVSNIQFVLYLTSESQSKS